MSLPVTCCIGAERDDFVYCSLHARAEDMLILLEEISVPESFPEWDAARRALLAQIRGGR